MDFRIVLGLFTHMQQLRELLGQLQTIERRLAAMNAPQTRSE
jgi:hypothetical protein